MSGTAGVEPALAAALADEMVALTGMVGDLAAELGGDIDTLRRHMVSLQTFDRITQTQLAIAAILRSGAPVAERLDAVPMDALARRLHAGYAEHAGAPAR